MHSRDLRHDLAIMKKRRIVEYGSKDGVLCNPREQNTEDLLSAMSEKLVETLRDKSLAGSFAGAYHENTQKQNCKNEYGNCQVHFVFLHREIDGRDNCSYDWSRKQNYQT